MVFFRAKYNTIPTIGKSIEQIMPKGPAFFFVSGFFSNSSAIAMNFNQLNLYNLLLVNALLTLYVLSSTIVVIVRQIKRSMNILVASLLKHN